MTQTIHHEGIVKRIDGEHVSVTIVQASACSGCAAKALCNSAESKEKEVDVFASNAAAYAVGERVVIVGRLTDARWAAFFAYGLPLLLLLLVLFFAVRLTGSESMGALWALLTVGFYYVCIYLFRHRLQQRFSFTLEKYQQINQ